MPPLGTRPAVHVPTVCDGAYAVSDQTVRIDVLCERVRRSDDTSEGDRDALIAFPGETESLDTFTSPIGSVVCA